MKKTVIAALLILGVAAGIALAQVPGANFVTALSGRYSLGINTAGPQSAIVPLNASTVTCNGTSTVTTANTNVTAGSFIVFTVKTPTGTVGAYPAVQALVAGTSFDIKCTASDTSIYNYFILG